LRIAYVDFFLGKIQRTNPIRVGKWHPLTCLGFHFKKADSTDSVALSFKYNEPAPQAPPA